MARIRTIKPDFWTDEKIVELSAFARLLFIGLWNFADDEGRMECSPKRFKMQILPADPAEVPRLLDELQRQSLICIYVVDGIEYLQVCGFAKHQKVDKRSPSKYPSPPTPPRIPPSCPDGMEGNGREWKGMEESTPSVITKTTVASENAAGVVISQHNPEPAPRIDPAVYASVEALRIGAAVGNADHDRAGELWAVMAANGVKGTAMHPAVVEMARGGVTQDELRSAIAEARKSNGSSLNPAYLAAIVERLRTAPSKLDASWASDDRATEKMARELGLWPARAGESWDDLRRRVRDKIAKTARESVR